MNCLARASRRKDDFDLVGGLEPRVACTNSNSIVMMSHPRALMLMKRGLWFGRISSKTCEKRECNVDAHVLAKSGVNKANDFLWFAGQ
ncbi:hypothetical protein V6N11_050253 [Hibiscus sabdariffa]|uniref:Uncharacterized protein n=2 Tax=Hibiscus sabdariffa TaxID=183260 RepID=A0ABR2AT63_9ROSI